MNFFKNQKKFFGGIKIPDRKKATENLSIISLPLPPKVIIPVIQHVGEAASPIVKKGDKVKTGQLIARASSSVSSNIHSSINGMVGEIGKFPHPTLKESRAILIESDDTTLSPGPMQLLTENEAESLNADEILKKIEEAGIVGLGGAVFPTHVKLRPHNDRKIKTYIVNGAECEPFVTCDYRLVIEKAKEIILGLKLAMRVTGAQRALVAIEKNKRQAIEIFKKLLKNEDGVDIVSLNTRYPQGAEKQLIKTLLNKEVPCGKLPRDLGIIVNNIATLFAIYEAIYKAKPFYEEVITVSGGGIMRPANLRVRIGVSLRKILEFCGVRSASKIKVIVGGPMMGYAQSTLETPIIKGSSCVLVFINEEVKVFEDNACIKCAKCVDVCPMRLVPMKIAQLVKREKISELDKFNIEECIECGSCAYICPASIPLVEWIKLGKIKKRSLR